MEKTIIQPVFSMHVIGMVGRKGGYTSQNPGSGRDTSRTQSLTLEVVVPKSRTHKVGIQVDLVQLPSINMWLVFLNDTSLCYILSIMQIQMEEPEYPLILPVERVKHDSNWSCFIKSSFSNLISFHYYFVC